MRWRTRSRSSATIRPGTTRPIVLTGRPSSRSWPHRESTCPTNAAWGTSRGRSSARPRSSGLATPASAYEGRVRRHTPSWSLATAQTGPSCSAAWWQRPVTRGRWACRPPRCELDQRFRSPAHLPPASTTLWPLSTSRQRAPVIVSNQKCRCSVKHRRCDPVCVAAGIDVGERDGDLAHMSS